MEILIDELLDCVHETNIVKFFHFSNNSQCSKSHVTIFCVDLQIATYLSGRGWRVIAGCRQGGLGARLADSWLQAHIASTPEDEPAPRLATLELDVAREDLLEEAARATAQHLPAGEHGKLLLLFVWHINDAILRDRRR